jgi:hypothetical protein
MRCHKCGYISFDHLSECKKCGVDLTGTRDRLGMAPVKPSEPFLLGGLLKDYKKDLRTESVAPVGAAQMGMESGDIEFDSETSFDLEFADFEDRDSSGESFPGQAQVRDQLDSARKVLEDIEGARQTSRPAATESAMDLDLDSALYEASVDDMEALHGADSEPLGALPEDMEIELSMEDLDQFIEDSEPTKPIEARRKTAADSSGSVAGSTLELIMNDEPPLKAAAEEELAIELSAEDLEGLLQELDETTGGKEKKGKDRP